MKNYYKIMGLRMSATDEDVKRAYRQLAKRYHPDINPGSTAAANKFQDLTEAYDVLSDAEKRAEYDKQVSLIMAQKQMTSARPSARYTQSPDGQWRASYGPRSSSSQQSGSHGQSAAYQNAAYQQAYAQAYQMAADAQKTGFNKGYQQGFTDAQKRAVEEADKYKRRIDELNEALSAAEKKRREAEEEVRRKAEELLSCSRIIKGKQNNLAETERRLREIKEDASRQIKAAAEAAEKKVAETKADADKRVSAANGQADYQREQRAKADVELKKMIFELESLKTENQMLRDSLSGWEAYGKSKAYADDMQKRELEWDAKVKADKKRAKNTLYGTLGVLIWATEEELHDSYVKLAARYQKKPDDPKAKDKLFAVNDAYRILSDPMTRRIYNESIGVTEEEIEEERRLKEEFEQMRDSFESEMAEQDFWNYVEDLMYLAQTGDADAQNTLGEMYYYGDEIEKDLEQAVYWFKEAAKQKHADAMFNLGTCLKNGEGAARDEAKGNGFIKQAEKLRQLAKQTKKSAKDKSPDKSAAKPAPAAATEG